MIPLTLAEIAAATGGTLAGGATGDELVTGSVEFDSRKVTPGGLFVAIAGERADGHDFAAKAVADGAAGVLASRDPGVPSVVVEGDILIALGKLARAVVDRLPGLTIVGLTGSSGKTSTKDLLAHLLAPLGPVIAPPGSFNNELGHPYTVLKADPSTRFLVLEKGARGLGHIRWLTEVAPPRIGVVLNVGAAHAGEFGGIEVTAQAKGELAEALPADGVAILCADDPRVRAMADRTSARVVLTGQAPDAQVRAENVLLDELGRPEFTLVTPAGEVPVRLALHGEHHVGNALAAAAVALEAGLPLAQVAELLGTARAASRWRMEVTERADGVTVVNDAYNANPDSMRAALKALKAMTHGGRRAWAVLGQMNELGEDSLAEHDAIGRLVVRLNVDRLVVVGEQAGPIHAGACLEGSWGDESTHVPDIAAAVEVLRAELRPGDVVLVKASRSVGLERIADALLSQEPHQQEHEHNDGTVRGATEGDAE
ncbi:MAG: UDP-N-acetylmuramoyl-tripeptide--D-alanyl-D-alanine ligase [Cryptosporangiaceae bacterium]|nr:UDP-N-acetylmuramoyl-tripeptide--D-alanyl-D-alanine ligase [Cryptosporangiaceae bacterium]